MILCLSICRQQPLLVLPVALFTKHDGLVEVGHFPYPGDAFVATVAPAHAAPLLPPRQLIVADFAQVGGQQPRRPPGPRLHILTELLVKMFGGGRIVEPGIEQPLIVLIPVLLGLDLADEGVDLFFRHLG